MRFFHLVPYAEGAAMRGSPEPDIWMQHPDNPYRLDHDKANAWEMGRMSPKLPEKPREDVTLGPLIYATGTMLVRVVPGDGLDMLLRDPLVPKCPECGGIEGFVHVEGCSQ